MSLLLIGVCLFVLCDLCLSVQVALVLLFETLLQNPLATHHMLQLILSAGLDICGLRLLYPQHNLLLCTTGNTLSAHRTFTNLTTLVSTMGRYEHDFKLPLVFSSESQIHSGLFAFICSPCYISASVVTLTFSVAFILL